MVGVKYKVFEGDRFVRANKGVLISTGGFGMNKEMALQYSPLLADERVNIVGCTYANGSGIEMGLAAEVIPFLYVNFSLIKIMIRSASSPSDMPGKG